MKKQRLLYLVLTMILSINFITNAQEGKFALTVNDTNQITALRGYLSLLKYHRPDLKDNKFVVILYEERYSSEMKDGTTYFIDVHVMATKTNDIIKINEKYKNLNNSYGYGINAPGTQCRT